LAPDAVDGRGVAGAAHPTNTGLGRVAEPFLFAVQRASAPRHHKVVPGQQTLTTGQMAKPAAALDVASVDGNCRQYTSIEIATWEKRPGPFLLQANGKPYSRKLFWKHFDEARESIPELADVTLHGLRRTAVIRLRRAGLSVGQIGDIAGMSLATIERYCRFADRKTSGQAALVQLTNNAATVKRRRQL
jgi:hypothetical protein